MTRVHLQTEICDSLEKYNKEINTLKHKMEVIHGTPSVSSTINIICTLSILMFPYISGRVNPTQAYAATAASIRSSIKVLRRRHTDVAG